MEVVDCHQHFWDLSTHGAHYEWITSIPDGDKIESLKRASYLVEDFKRDTEGLNVVKTVHVQGEWRGDEVGETAWLSQLADSNPDGFPHAIVGYVNLGSDSAAQMLDEHCKFGRFRGVRQLLNWHDTDVSKRVAERDYLSDQSWRDRFGLLEERNLVFEFHIFPWQYAQAAELAKQWPRVQFLLDHVGCPILREDKDVEEWRAGLHLLAAQPNIACKISGLIHPMHTNPGEWSAETLKKWVFGPLDAFGPDRCLYASNFPVDRVCGSYKDMLSAVKTLFEQYGLTEDDQHKVFSKNAHRIYRL